METDPIQSIHLVMKTKSVESTKKVDSTSLSSPLNTTKPIDQVTLTPEAEERLKIEDFVEKIKSMPEIRPQAIETALETQITQEAWATIARKIAEGE